MVSLHSLRTSFEFFLRAFDNLPTRRAIHKIVSASTSWFGTATSSFDDPRRDTLSTDSIRTITAKEINLHRQTRAVVMSAESIVTYATIVVRSNRSFINKSLELFSLGIINHGKR